MFEKVKQTAEFLKSAGITTPEIGIVLGTGLGKLINDFEIIKTIDYKDIPNFPLATVESHNGQLIYGKFNGRFILAMKGRFHYYEGYSLQQVTFPVRVMKLLGIKYLLLSNAAGALNLRFKKGSLMLIDDHISFLPDNPLRGENPAEFGPRFPDMSQPYSRKLNNLMLSIADREDIILHRGVYASVVGPSLETRAEYRFYGNFADAIGMSTVPEVIVAAQVGLTCCAVSVLTDECNPDHLEQATLEDILEVAAKGEIPLIKLFTCLIRELK
jgi:purine-nucleoside phosphorylase